MASRQPRSSKVDAAPDAAEAPIRIRQADVVGKNSNLQPDEYYVDEWRAEIKKGSTKSADFKGEFIDNSLDKQAHREEVAYKKQSHVFLGDPSNVYHESSQRQQFRQYDPEERKEFKTQRAPNLNNAPSNLLKSEKDIDEWRSVLSSTAKSDFVAKEIAPNVSADREKLKKNNRSSHILLGNDADTWGSTTKGDYQEFKSEPYYRRTRVMTTNVLGQASEEHHLKEWRGVLQTSSASSFADPVTKGQFERAQPVMSSSVKTRSEVSFGSDQNTWQSLAEASYKPFSFRKVSR